MFDRKKTRGIEPGRLLMKCLDYKDIYYDNFITRKSFLISSFELVVKERKIRSFFLLMAKLGVSENCRVGQIRDSKSFNSQ